MTMGYESLIGGLHVTLPADVNAGEFTHKLTELVEAYGGTVGGDKAALEA
jgi:hypothetical protein